MQVGFMM